MIIKCDKNIKNDKKIKNTGRNNSVANMRVLVDFKSDFSLVSWHKPSPDWRWRLGSRTRNPTHCSLRTLATMLKKTRSLNRTLKLRIMKYVLIGFLFLLTISCSNSKYEILKEKQSLKVCRLQIKLNGIMTQDELKEIALELRNTRMDYDKVWISFFQPDLLPDESGNGAWAVANFTPDLEIDILGDEKQNTSETDSIKFPKYANVIDLLNASGDYKENCIELLSKDGETTHIRVSKEFLKNEPISNINEQVKRDIIYVAFQAFAETDIDLIKISSIPMIRSTFNPNVAYDGKLLESAKQTIAINRTKALEILNKYLKTTSFQDLYQLSGTMYLPNEKFDRLKFGELNNVFADLKK